MIKKRMHNPISSLVHYDSKNYFASLGNHMLFYLRLLRTDQM